MTEEITTQNLQDVDVKSLALNTEKFGTLTFNTVYSKLEDLKKIFVQLTTQDYKTFLPDDRANRADQLLGSYIERLNWLRGFDPAQSGNVTQEKVDFENRVREIHAQVYNELVPYIAHLRISNFLDNPEQHELDQIKEDARSVALESQETLESLKKELERLRSEKKEIAETKGEVGAKTSGKLFESQAALHKTEKDRFAGERKFFFYILLAIVILNVLAYLLLFVFGDVKGVWSYKTDSIFTLQYGLLKLAVLVLISYAISFASKNYRIHAHLESVNRHRKNIAETLNKFLEATPSEQDRSTVLSEGVKAMFEHLPTGFDNYNDRQSDSGPVHEIVNNFFRTPEK